MNQTTGLKSDMLRGDLSMDCVLRFWGELGGNRWPEGSKLRRSLETAICKPSDGVKGNEYHTVSR